MGAWSVGWPDLSPAAFEVDGPGRCPVLLLPLGASALRGQTSAGSRVWCTPPLLTERLAPRVALPTERTLAAPF